MWVNDPCARNVALCHIILTTCLIWWILTILFLNVVDIINPFHRRLSFSLKTDSTNSCILCHLSGRTAEKEILKTPVDWSLPFLLRHIGFCFCFFLLYFYASANEAGGITFSGCPSVRAYVRLLVFYTFLFLKYYACLAECCKINTCASQKDIIWWHVSNVFIEFAAFTATSWPLADVLWSCRYRVNQVKPRVLHISTHSTARLNNQHIHRIDGGYYYLRSLRCYIPAKCVY